MAKSRVGKYDWTPALLFCVLKRVCFAILCYCFHPKSLLFFLWRKHFCAVTLSRSFSFHLQKNSIDILSAPCVRQCVFVCLLSGHPSWVFLLQCFFQLTNSRFPSMGLMDWHIQAPCPHSLAHTRKHRKKQQSAFQLCRSGQPTDGILFWWSTAVYRNNL